MSQGYAKEKVDHGVMLGLSDDDHAQYLNETRHAGVHANARIERITSNQSIPNNTVTQAALNGTIFENDPDGDITIGSNGITINTTGVYLVGAGCDWASSGAGSRLMLVRVDGTTIATDRRTATASTNQAASTLTEITAGQFVDLDVLQDSGGALDLDAAPGTYLFVMRVT